MKSTKKRLWISAILCATAAMSAPLFTGCQVTVAGQTLPSGYYLQDDVQYYPAGPEFKLTREAAAMREARSAFNR